MFKEKKEQKTCVNNMSQMLNYALSVCTVVVFFYDC